MRLSPVVGLMETLGKAPVVSRLKVVAAVADMLLVSFCVGVITFGLFLRIVRRLKEGCVKRVFLF